MANKTKKISVAAMDEVVKEHFPNTVTKQWFGNELIIKKTIPIAEVLAFVDIVVSVCSQMDNGYLPELKEFLIKKNILTRYANFNITENLEHGYNLVYGTDAVDVVMEEINQTQLQDIRNAIDDKLDYICDSNISAIERKLQEAIASFDDIREKGEALFDGVDAGDITKLIGAITTNGGIDEGKLVKAFIDSKEEPATEGNAE